jgi:hypothetical protein
MRSLGTLGGLSFALAINAFGTIVGSSAPSGSSRSDPVVWRGAGPLSLGLPSTFDYGFAYGVSFLGNATGSLETDSGADAFFWHAGVLDDLGRLGGFAFTNGLAINSANEVVGVAFQTRGGAARAMLWRAGAMSDLNALLPTGSRWTLRAANDVNDLGQIVGDGVLANQLRGYVLTPPLREQAANLVPFVQALEPGATAFERRAVGALNGAVRGKRGCKGLAALERAAAKEKGLSAVRRAALDVRVGAFAKHAGC